MPNSLVQTLVALLPLIAACGDGRGQAPAARTAAIASGEARDTLSSAAYVPPAALDDGLPVATAAGLGLDTGALARLTNAIRSGEYRDVHAVLAARDGRLVYEAYFAGEDVHSRRGRLGRVDFTHDTRHDLRSVSKSVVSLVLGIALAGDTAALDRPILDFFPEFRHLATPERMAVRLRHVLDMTAGLEWRETGPYGGADNDGSLMGRSDDPTRFVLERAVVTAPGTRWNYSGGQTHLLAEVVRRVTGRPLLDLARDALFTPMGITDVEWVPYEGNALPDADSGLRLRPRDALKLGLLVAAGGEWQGRRIVPAAWVAASRQRAVATADSLVEVGPGAHVQVGYARQWWHARYALPYRSFTAHYMLGNGGQLVFLVPAERLVVVVTGGRYDGSNDALRLTIERVVPWAMGLGDSTYRFPARRTFRPIAPGERTAPALDAVQRARYVGDYRYDRDTVRVTDEGGVLRISGLGGDESPYELVPMGGNAFALGSYEGGRLTRLYWPDDRVEFSVAGQRVTGFVDRSAQGEVYGRAARVR